MTASLLSMFETEQAEGYYRERDEEQSKVARICMSNFSFQLLYTE